MATVAITGTIQNASGVGVENVVVQLVPEAPDAGSAAAIGGVGIVLDTVTVATNSSGVFSVTAVVGFRYRLTIEAIGFSRTFVAPDLGSVRFDLLGLEPTIESVADYVDEDGTAKNEITVKVEPLATVRERFDVLVIERHTKVGAFWLIEEIAELDLLDNETFYEYTDEFANTGWYAARYKRDPDTSQGSERRQADGPASAVLLSVDELKELYLFGVDLTNPATGEKYPDRMFSHYIDTAIRWLEKELDIDLIARDYTEVHDHLATDYARWGWFQLDHYPILRIDSVRFQYPSMESSVTIDSEWIILQDDGKTGQLQIVPGRGNIADVLLIPGSLMPLWSGATGRVPGVWHIAYRSGFEPGKTVEEGGLPADLKHLVAMAASIGILNIAGDLVAGAGIASMSISVPGLSQSIGTTSSATNSGYGARIIEYQKEIKEALPNLRRYYGKGTRMVVA